ncbi:MAG TPA: hypothetical protein VHK91_10030 [Flavisolibacter sp.]|nr:hypothetical protein [Flavisolibacter sp.]
MKKLLFVFACFYLVSCKKDETPCHTTDFRMLYGGSGFDAAASVIESQDCGYLFAGITQSNDGAVSGNHGNADAWVVRVNSQGAIIWQKPFGGSDGDQANSLTSAMDGRYAIAGLSFSQDGDAAGNHGGEDAFIVSFNEQGNRIWQKMLGGQESDAAKCITATPDGGYIMAGLSNSNNGDVYGNHGSFDAWVVKLDRWGHITWQKTYGGSGVDVANCIINTLDGGYLLAGETSSNDGDVSGNHGANDFWVIKLDRQGMVQWKKVLGGSNHDAAFSATLASDGGFVISGSTETGSPREGFENNWVVRLTKQGTLVWQKIFGIQASGGNALSLCDKSGFTLVSGGTVLKIDENGNEVWRKFESGTFQSIFPRRDGSYIIVGGIPNGVKNSDALLATVR